VGYPEQYSGTEPNPPPGDGLDMDCRAENCRACIGPPGTECAHSCHTGVRIAYGPELYGDELDAAYADPAEGMT
jgi:hypothetical protein